MNCSSTNDLSSANDLSFDKLPVQFYFTVNILMHVFFFHTQVC